MALQGNYTHYTYENHPTETVTQTITYPSDLPEGHENYDKMGTTEEVTVPSIVETPTTYENCVIGLRTVNTFVMRNDGSESKNKIVNLSYDFRIYASLEDKENYFNENFLAEYTHFSDQAYSPTENAWEIAYNEIKASKGGSELINI